MISLSVCRLETFAESVSRVFQAALNQPFGIIESIVRIVLLPPNQVKLPKMSLEVKTLTDSVLALSLLGDPLWKILAAPAASKNKKLVQKNIEHLRDEFWSKGFT